MNYKHLLLLLFISLALNSCQDNTDCCPMPEPDAAFKNGTFVLNEGNFGSANASVTFIAENDEIHPEIFKNVNGFSLGDTAQSIEMFEQLAVIVLNVSNKIEIVNRYTFKSLGTIDTHLQNPRYAKVVENKLYVTNWGDGMNPDDDFIAIFDMNDFTFIKDISVAEGPEKLLTTNNKIYVAHKGGFSFNNIISVIDASSNSIQTEIEVGDQPNSMILLNNSLWVLASGKPSYADAETAGSLSKINLGTNEVTNQLLFSSTSVHPENLSMNNNQFYYSIGKSVYGYSPGNESLPENAEFEVDEVSILYGFEVNDNKLFIASPNAGFTGDGKLYVHDLNTKSLLNTYTTGINPNGIYFNN